MSAEIAQVINVVLAGVLAGNEFATWAVVHCAVAGLDIPTQVALERELTRRFLSIMPALMVGAVASGLVVLALLPPEEPSGFRFTLAGTAMLAVMMAVTLIGNMPLNVATVRTSVEIDPGAWRALRRRWNRLHGWRVALDLGGFAVLATGGVT